MSDPWDVGPADKTIFEDKFSPGDYVRVMGDLAIVEYYDDDLNLVCVQYQEDNVKYHIKEGDRAMYPVSLLFSLEEKDEDDE